MCKKPTVCEPKLAVNESEIATLKMIALSVIWANLELIWADFELILGYFQGVVELTSLLLSLFVLLYNFLGENWELGAPERQIDMKLRVTGTRNQCEKVGLVSGTYPYDFSMGGRIFVLIFDFPTGSVRNF